MRLVNLTKLYNKTFKNFDFGIDWRNVFGTPERAGIWLIWGDEKNGKTWFALKLAEYLSKFEKVIYVSGEEGMSYDFTSAVKRANVESGKNLFFAEYSPVEEIEERLDKQRSPNVIFFDNITVYSDELKGGKLRKLQQKYPHKLFIFLAHEEAKQPYTAVAKLCKKLSNILIHVEGLRAEISGRCPGGIMNIDEKKATIYWGEVNN